MEEKLFQDKYRIKSTRLPNWDYSWDGFYYATICTKYWIEWFGKINDENMFLSPFGAIVESCWRMIPEHFPFVTLDEYVIMPNHVHGVIRILKSQNDSAMVETQDFASLHPAKPLNKFGPQSRNLASIIRGFKIGVTKWARNNGCADFQWQQRFYDHVVRDQNDLERIRHYIQTNPERWCRDRNNFANEFKFHD